MAWLKAKDTISGQEGRAYATIDGDVEEMFYIKSLEATVEKEKTDVKTLGKRGTQHKANGWSGSGSMTVYYTTTRFRQLMLKYIKEGVDTYFDIMVVNDDPSSSIGQQTVILKGVNLDSVIMAKVDTDSEVLDEDIDFTFDDVDIQDSFTAPTLGA
ncbi:MULTISPECIES: phage tail tube protein [Paenibacillus]|uniref:phage tail tube protein n=1 Tax=Paenibacillus TaxID=44249 RepID=UPI000737B199|nr:MULTISPECIES: phage tail tube protein [Paenibacillus]MBU9707137.1 phage tail tube protein [Paenibacillus sp. AK121]MEE4566361.1 phage tail tube protein [Paenibacillus polymyxa]MEE4577865.1 phage tail tube protein [Paenibacillus polymyxa]